MTVTVIRSVPLSIGLLALAFAAIEDIRSRTIPNRLVIVVAVSGLILGALSRPFSMWINIIVALAVVIIFAALSHLDSLGGGDVKLMAATTLLVPPSRITGLLVAVALAGGALSLVYLAVHFAMPGKRKTDRLHHQRSAIPRWWYHERARIADGRTIPYAVAISGGSIVYIIAEWHRCLSATSCSL